MANYNALDDFRKNENGIVTLTTGGFLVLCSQKLAISTTSSPS